MPDPTVFSSLRHFLAVGKETVQGTAVPPTQTAPVNNFDPEDKVVWLDDDALRGSLTGPYNRVAGVQHSEFAFAGPAFFDTLGFFLANILGDVVEAGASAPFTHTFSTLNTGNGQPSSLTLVSWEGPTPTVFARAYSGACLSELNIKGNAASSVIEMDAKGMGWPSAAAAAQPTSAPSAIPPEAAWVAKHGVNGTVLGQQVKTISEWEVNIKRQLEVIYTGQNTPNPYFIMRGKLTVGGKMSVVAADLTPLTYLLSNTQPQLQTIIDNGVVGAGQLALQIDINKGASATTKPNFSKTAVGYDVTYDGIANTTNAGGSSGFSPISVVLTNSVPASTY